MLGKIDKVWENEAQNGKAYLVLEIDGQRYSLWDAEWLGRLRDGDIVQYDWKKSGKFRNITDIDRVKPDPDTPPVNEKDDQIVRMSCLKSASSLFSGSDLDAKKKVRYTMAAAERFERYIRADGESDEEPVPEPPPEPGRVPEPEE